MLVFPIYEVKMKRVAPGENIFYPPVPLANKLPTTTLNCNRVKKLAYIRLTLIF
jgi:hypothetical protein